MSRLPSYDNEYVKGNREKEENIKVLQTGPSSNFKLETFREKTPCYAGLNKLQAASMLSLEPSDFYFFVVVLSTPLLLMDFLVEFSPWQHRGETGSNIRNSLKVKLHQCPLKGPQTPAFKTSTKGTTSRLNQGVAFCHGEASAFPASLQKVLQFMDDLTTRTFPNKKQLLRSWPRKMCHREQQQRHLDAHQKCRISGPTQDVMNQNLHVIRPLG